MPKVLGASILDVVQNGKLSYLLEETNFRKKLCCSD